MKNRNESQIIKHFDFLLLDLLCLGISFYISFRIKGIDDNIVGQESYLYLLLTILILNFIVGVFYEPYKNILRKGFLKELKTTSIFVAINVLVISFAFFVLKIGSDYSRQVVLLTYGIDFILSYLVKIAYKGILHRNSIVALYNNNNNNNGRNKALLILCKQNRLNSVIEDIEQNNFAFYFISGICVIDKKSKGKSYKKHPIVGSLNDVLDYVSKNWVDEIYIDCEYEEIPKKVMDGLMVTGIPIHLRYEDKHLFEGRKQYFDKFANYHVITAVANDYNNYQLFFKKLLDIVGGIVGSLICVILMIIIGPIIYIKSPGPIIYTSDRVGRNGKIFKFYKFRSMVLNADDLKDDLRKKNRSKDQMMFKIENDPRIIPGIGNFIRKTSLDEFPQFFNVLKGDMSLVGTRPPTMDEWNKYTPYYRSRMSTQPGITGMWQVSGRSEITDFEEVVRLDNEYINNWSLSLDIKILFLTVFKLFKRDKGAM